MNRALRTSAALLLSAVLFSSAAAGVRAAEVRASELPPATAIDVAESLQLLLTSAYKQIAPQAALDGALAALAAEGRVRHVDLHLPSLRAHGPDDDADALDRAIVYAADQMHVTPTEAAYTAIRGMTSAADDKYTVFFTPDQFKLFNDELDPTAISGIGVIIGPDTATGYVQAVYVVPGTPADRAGIQAGDDLPTIDGTSTKGLVQDDITKLLRGRAGTVVHVAVSRNGVSLGQPFAIVRAEIETPTVVYRMLPDKVAYLAIFAFGEETPQQFDDALTKVRVDGARALVVDLRNNGGGYVRSAQEITSEFLSDKPVFTMEMRDENPFVVRTDSGPVVTLPLAVLVNQYSASASEITAGALQDDGAGTLIGTKTFGKGVMQTVTQFADGAAIKITTAHYLTPSDRDINLRGLEPNIRVDENLHPIFGDPDRDAQLHAALSLLEKKIALAH